MNVLDNHLTIGELVAQRPSRARVFETFGIDYCCGGHESLEAVCARKSLAVQTLLAALDESDRAVPAAEETDWTLASLKDLVDHIEFKHHGYLKQNLPRLTSLVNKVAAVHHVRHPEMLEVRDRFNAMRAELESHCKEEEEEFFPLCRELSEHKLQTASTSDLGREIQDLEAEHDGTGKTLEKLRSLTHGYIVPADGCSTYRALLDGLRDLELDLHIHVNKENSVLYPKVLAAQKMETSNR
jgi:regulator of cell morphogenesis and NO signaling